MVEEYNSIMQRGCSSESSITSHSQFSSNYIDIAHLQFNMTGEKKSLFRRNRGSLKKSASSFKILDSQESEKLVLKSEDAKQPMTNRNPKLTQWKAKNKTILQYSSSIGVCSDNYSLQSVGCESGDDSSSTQSFSSRSTQCTHTSAFASYRTTDKLRPRTSSSFSFGQNYVQRQKQKKQFLTHSSPLMSPSMLSPRTSEDFPCSTNPPAFPPMHYAGSCSNLQQEMICEEGGNDEEMLNYIDQKTPRKMSTRDKYLMSDSNNFWSQDPADQLKKQLISMLVSDPEIEKRIKDVVSTEEDVDLATTTTQLDVQVDKSGAFCINQYIMIKTIGKGAIGTVKLCYNTLDKKLYAVKMIDRNELTQSRMGRVLKKDRKCRQLDKQHSALLREIAVLKKLEHHNIVNLHEVIDPPNKSQPVMLVMEYLEGGPVVKQLQHKPGYFQKLSEEEATEYFRMMCTGLDFLHYNRIVHGDLKPDNLLLDKVGELKIADFGCARIMAEDNNFDINNKYGTPSFRPPEMQTGKHYDPFNADVWAMGVCLYIMVFGELPFKGSFEKEIYDNIQNQELVFPEETQISDELKDLLRIILAKNPLKRANLYDIMNHKWVTEFGQIQLISLIQMTRPPSPVEVTEKEANLAINQSADRLIKLEFEERIFYDGEYLLRDGDTTSALYFILSGAVEIRDPKWMSRENHVRRQSFVVERDSSTMFCQFVDEGEDEGEEDGDIYFNSEKTLEVASRLKCKGSEDLLLEVKGPANIIGDISICYPIKPYPYNVVARGQVHALELTSDKLQNALMSLYDQQSKNILSLFTKQLPLMPTKLSNVQQKVQIFNKPDMIYY